MNFLHPRELTTQEFNNLNKARRMARVSSQAIRYGFDGNLLAVPLSAIAVASSARGERLASAASVGSSMISFPLIQGGLAAGLALIPGIGEGAILALSMAGALFPSSAIEARTHRGFRAFSQAGERIRRLEFGQGYQDNDSAFNQRQRSLAEISATMQTSRRYLGQEARLLHR